MNLIIKIGGVSAFIFALFLFLTVADKFNIGNRLIHDNAKCHSVMRTFCNVFGGNWRPRLPEYGACSGCITPVRLSCYPSDLYPTLERAIEHERRVELCFEFHRFFDLVRTRRAVDVISQKWYNITEEKLLFPVPQNAIDSNPRVTQNPGY